MPQLYVSKGTYQVSANDILDTLNGGVSANGDLHVSGNIYFKAGTNFALELTHSLTQNSVFTLPNVGPTAHIPVTEGTQTWTGAQTFQNNNIHTAITHFRVALANIANVIDITANGVLGNGQFTAFVLGNSVTNNNSFQISYVHNSISGGRYLSIGPFESGVGSGCMNFVANNLVQFIVSTTGGGSASLSNNCPAITPGSPYTWIKIIVPDGNIGFIPVWK